MTSKFVQAMEDWLISQAPAQKEKPIKESTKVSTINLKEINDKVVAITKINGMILSLQNFKKNAIAKGDKNAAFDIQCAIDDLHKIMSEG